MALITLIFNRLNIPLSKKKTVGPHTTLEYLGIILDTDKMEARLPQDKVERIIHFIGTFLRRRSIKNENYYNSWDISILQRESLYLDKLS